MNNENRQAHTLFGVVALFCFGHTLRIILNMHDIVIAKSEEISECECFDGKNSILLDSTQLNSTLLNSSCFQKIYIPIAFWALVSFKCAITLLEFIISPQGGVHLIIALSKGS